MSQERGMKITYKKPEIKTYTAEELSELIGPAQCYSGDFPYDF